MLQRTLIIIKPHAVEKGLVGKIIGRFEQAGLKIVELKVLKGSSELWEKFYPSEELWFKNVGSKTLENCKLNNIDIKIHLNTDNPIEIGKTIKTWLVAHMSAGIAVAAILEGNEAIQKVRTICGHTLPNLANPGTIRFDFSTDSPSIANSEKRPVFNLIHASDPNELRNGMPAPEFEINTIFQELSKNGPQ